MAKNTGIASLFDRSYRTGDPQLDALFGLTDVQEEELPPLRAPERREAPREEAPREIRGKKGASNNAQIAYNFYINKGLAPHQAAGVVGSMMQESGPDLDPNARNAVGAYGIMQAMGSRKDALLQSGAKGDLLKQLEFSWAEMQGPENNALKQILAAETPAQAAIAHRKYYERPGEKEARDDKRIQYANQLLSGGYQPQSQFTRSADFQPHVVGAGLKKSPISQTDPRLQEILSIAAQNSPFDVQFKSGYRPGDKRQHGKHNAIDVQLVDKRTGEAFADYQDPRHFRDYEQFAQTARQVQEQLYPELGDAFRWGGYFSGKKNYGALDLMHFDIGGGEGLGMRGGSWEGGLNDQQRSLWKGVQSQGMGQRAAQPQYAQAPQLASTQAPQEPQESPYYPVRLSDGQIVDVEKGMELSEVAAMLKQNGIEATPLRPYTAPDGQEFDVEYDMTDDEVLNILNKPAPGESNYLGALKHNWQEAVAGGAMGAGTELGALGERAASAGFLGDYAQPVSEFLREKGAQAHTYGEELGKEIEGKYTRPTGLNAFEENITYPIAEGLGSMGAYMMAAPLAAIPGVGPAAAAIGTAGLFHSSTMGEGEQQAIAAGKEWNPDEYRFPYALASDAANLAGFGIFNKALKIFGKEAILGSREAIQAAVEKGGIEEAKKVVGSRLKNVAGEFLKGETALVSGEVIEDAINREYLGKPLLSEEALQQYGETAKQVGPLGLVTGPMAGLGAHYNKATEVARLEEQADVAQKLEAQEMERAKAENLATIGVTPEQLQKFGVKKELEGLSDEELLDAFKADLAEKEAAKAAKIEALPEELRNVPYKEAKVYQQMLQEKEAGEVPSEEVIPSEEVPSEEVTPPVSEPTLPVSEPTLPVTEPTAPVEPVSGVTPPAAEMGAEEIPEPFVRGRAPEVTNPADILGLKSNSGLRKQLQSLDVNNAADHPKIDAILQKTSATFSAENLATLETKMKEVQNAVVQPQAGPSVRSGSAQPEIRQEGRGVPEISQGVEPSRQGIEAPEIPQTKAPEVEAELSAPKFRVPNKNEQSVASGQREMALDLNGLSYLFSKPPRKGEMGKLDGAREITILDTKEVNTPYPTQDKFDINVLRTWDGRALNRSSLKNPASTAEKWNARVPEPLREPLLKYSEATTYEEARQAMGEFYEAAKKLHAEKAPEVKVSEVEGPIIDKSESPYIKGGFDVTKPDIRETKLENPDKGIRTVAPQTYADVTNTRELVQRFKEKGTDPELLKLMNAINASPHLGSIPVRWLKVGDKVHPDIAERFRRGAAAMAAWDDKTGPTLYFRSGDASLREDTIVHEAVHAVTEAALRRNPEGNKELSKLAKQIGYSLSEEAGFAKDAKKDQLRDFWQEAVNNDPGELLAYGLTSPSFRETLKQYGADGKPFKAYRTEAELNALRKGQEKPERTFREQAPKQLTLWDKFVDAIAKLFGLPSKRKEEFARQLNDYLDKKAAYEQKVSDYNTLRPLQERLDAAFKEALRETSKKGVDFEAGDIKEAKQELPKPSKEEVRQAEERLKAAGLTGKITEEPLGTKMRRVTNDIFKEGRNTSFAAEYVDIRQPIAKAVQDLPSNVGEKLRSDYIWGAYEQRGNVIQESYRKGFIAMGRDGTLEAIPDAQLAVENIFKRVGKENAKVFGDVLVAHRVRSIRKKDAEIHAQANKLRNMAEQMEDYASTLKDAAKRKKFNASARSLYKAAEKKMEIINWGEGRTEFSEELAKEADKVLAANPHLAREAENVYALLRKQVDLWEQEGMIDKATANDWRSYPNYFPLYKSSATDAKGVKISYDEMLANPTEYIQKHITPYMGRGAKSLPKVHKQEWHQHAVFVEENLLRHLAFFASAAAEHSARKNTAYNMELLGKATRQEHGKGDFVVKFREKGKDVFYKVEDPAAYYALQSAQPLLNPLLKRMRSVGNFARGVMIMNPLFWYRQVFREPLQASLVGRAGVITPFDTLGEIAKIATGKSEGYERLRAKGVIGPVDVIPDIAEYVKTIHNGKGSLQKSIEGIKHVHEAADAATRAVVYERAKAQAISQGFTEEVADSIGVMKAREIINFAKQGRGDLIRVARATTPFFGAALNSLDVMARAISPEKLGSLSKAEAMEARRNFYSTAMMVAMFSTAYAAAMSEDEDYLKNPDRKGNWLIPIGGGKFIKIPIPFEAGWFIKELPELATLLSLGAINKSEAITEGKTAFKENVLPPMPTVFSIEPLAEVIMDHDFYTGSSLEGRDAEVAVRDRNTKAGELTKAIVNKMEDYGINFLGMSANQLEHLNKSYLGQVWAITRAASDAYLNHGKVTPEKALSEYPMVGGIISEGKKDRAVDQFYRVYSQVSEIDKSKQRAVSIGDKERFDQIVNDPDNQKALRASDELRDIKKRIGEKRTGIAKIKEMKGITSEEMTKRINVLKEHEKVLAKRGVEVARKLGLEI